VADFIRYSKASHEIPTTQKAKGQPRPKRTSAEWQQRLQGAPRTPPFWSSEQAGRSTFGSSSVPCVLPNLAKPPETSVHTRKAGASCFGLTNQAK
jgi:hypothetical protein